jgi:hypothetical protein
VIVTFNPVDKPLHEQTGTAEISGDETRESLPRQGDVDLLMSIAATPSLRGAKARDSDGQDLILTFAGKIWRRNQAAASDLGKCVSI